MEKLQLISAHQCFDGMQYVYSHYSEKIKAPMRFAIFLPAIAKNQKVPLLFWLSGLTCTEENFIIKAGAQRIASLLGISIVTPDTSPRDLNIMGEKNSYDLGAGASFYLDATQPPWEPHYQMYSYISKELPALITEHFSIDESKIGIFGHSMGGFGALMVALKNPHYFKSVSAFSPICSLHHSPWAKKAFQAYLGENMSQWDQYDIIQLIKILGWNGPEILIDQGTDDSFLHTQLNPLLFVQACRESSIKVKLRMQKGYDHSYYFISSFIEDHLNYHVKILRT